MKKVETVRRWKLNLEYFCKLLYISEIKKLEKEKKEKKEKTSRGKTMTSRQALKKNLKTYQYNQAIYLLTRNVFTATYLRMLA